MRLTLVAGWGAVGFSVLGGALACGSDGGSGGGTTCGPGTVQKDGMCIVQCGTGTVLVDGQCMVLLGAGGDASPDSGGGDAQAGAAGMGEPEAPGSAGNHDGTAGMTGAGGALYGGTGGTGGVLPGGTGGTGGALPGGAGGTLAAGGNAGASGSSANAGASGGSATVPHWLAFSHTDGVFAYDTNQFPSDAGLVQLGSKGGSVSGSGWSPDGRRFLYSDHGDLYERDMSSPVPGNPKVLVAGALVTSYRWSADSKSLLCSASHGTYLLDPTLDAPSLHLVSTSTSGSFTWAPAGDHLLYTDTAGTHVVEVQAGVPSHDQLLTLGSIKGWTPDGKSLLAVSAGNLTMTDITGATPVTVTLSAATTASPTIASATVSADMSTVVYLGAQTRTVTDLYLVKLTAPGSAPILISSGLAATAQVVNLISWSRNGRWLVYSAVDLSLSSKTDWIVDLSGSTPSAPYQWVPFDLASLLWLPMQPNKAIGSSMTSASLIDVSMPSADPVALNLLSYVLSPTRDLIAYAGSTADITIRDLDATSPPISVPLDYISSGTSLRWSPDGKFLATPAGITSQLRMMRIDGGSPSAAISVYNSNGTVNSLYWPPVFP